MKGVLVVTSALTFCALCSVNASAQPNKLCVTTDPASYDDDLGVRFRLKSGHEKYAKSDDTELTTGAGYEGTFNVERCYNAKKLLAGRRNVDYHIQVKGATDCKTFRVPPEGPRWSGTKNFEINRYFAV